MMHYEIRLTQQDLGVIYAGLGELPLRSALNLFTRLQGEVARQDAESATPIAEIQKQFDAAVDRRDMPSGAPAP